MSETSEIAYWQRVASYLADCLAASAASLAMQKRLSRYERDRQIAICTSVASYLKQTREIGSKARPIHLVVERLDKAREALTK